MRLRPYGCTTPRPPWCRSWPERGHPARPNHRRHGRIPSRADALSFATRLAAVTGAKLTLLAAFPHGTGRTVRLAMCSAIRQATNPRQRFERVRGLDGGESVTTYAIADRSPRPGVGHVCRAQRRRTDRRRLDAPRPHRSRPARKHDRPPDAPRAVPGGDRADRLPHEQFGAHQDDRGRLTTAPRSRARLSTSPPRLRAVSGRNCG